MRKQSTVLYFIRHESYFDSCDIWTWRLSKSVPLSYKTRAKYSTSNF